MKDFSYELIKSWADKSGNVSTNEEIFGWVRERNETLVVSVEPIDFDYNGFWYYDNDSGYIRNQNNSFFQIAGIQQFAGDQILVEQPIILQPEIGFLGIICKMINGTLNFLMQAKIEPGNSNVVQISPTLQATKSNFTRKHGGKTPNYLDFFLNSSNHTILVDQIQSEQSSRFYKKRNRNIVILVEDDVPVIDSHRWMTLGQIKNLMKIDNLVNMDTRTVISCLLYKYPEDSIYCDEIQRVINEDSLFNSIFKLPEYSEIHEVFKCINDFRMFNQTECRLLPLKDLNNWVMTNRDISCKDRYSFNVIFCQIEIEDREVKNWKQPMVQALGESVFGVFTCIENGIRKYLVRIKGEIGCFDGAELGPAVQIEPQIAKTRMNEIESLMLDKVEKNKGVILNVIQSEEGGRFYHEENRNLIVEINKDEIGELPQGFFWMDFATITEMIQYNNCVNIQLRNLISLIDFPNSSNRV